jgi:transposase
MNKNKGTFGVDIRKDVFDVHGSIVGHNQYKNDALGFKKFLMELPREALVVMGATDYQHYRLAQFLYKNEVAVSVVNPISVNRFIQMKLAKVKTDKSDPKAICEYARISEVTLYNALTVVQSECLQHFRLQDAHISGVWPSRISFTAKRFSVCHRALYTVPCIVQGSTWIKR